MTRKTRGLRPTAGVAALLLILATGTALQLQAAGPLHTMDQQATPQGTQEPTSEVVATESPITVTSTPDPTSTPESTGPPTVLPTSTATPTISLPSSPPGTPTLTQPPSVLATPTWPPTATPAPTRPPTETPPPTATLTPAPPPTATLTPAPPPAATPTLSPFEIAFTYVQRNSFLAAAICLIPLLMLGLLLILAVLWKKRPQPEPPSPPPPPVPTGPYLESVDPAGGPRRLYLTPDGVTVGQSPENDIVITQDIPHWETVSRRHARIYEQAGRWIVEDVGSSNGIYVNGRRTGRNVLRDGWRLGIAGVEFVFRTNAGEE